MKTGMARPCTWVPSGAISSGSRYPKIPGRSVARSPQLGIGSGRPSRSANPSGTLAATTLRSRPAAAIIISMICGGNEMSLSIIKSQSSSVSERKRSASRFLLSSMKNPCWGRRVWSRRRRSFFAIS